MSHLMTKPTKLHVHPAKTQISLGIHPVWSVFAVRMKKAWVLSYPLSAQRRLWSDWADAQADRSLRWAHSHFAGFVMKRFKSVIYCPAAQTQKWFPFLIFNLAICNQQNKSTKQFQHFCVSIMFWHSCIYMSLTLGCGIWLYWFLITAF